MRAKRPARDSKPQRLSWKKIRVRYPDQWVVLVDVAWTGDDGEFVTAIVLADGKDRDETLRLADPIKAGYRDFAHRYTGRVRAPLASVNLALF